MPYTYPPSAPVVTGDFETISRFLATPTLVARRLRTVMEQRFIGDVLLSARVPVSGGGVIYQQNEGIFSDRPIEAVSPGGEYPITPISTGPANTARVVKWGQDTMITDEAIRRLNFAPVDRALLKMSNTLVKQVDSVCLSLIGSAVTQTQAATAAWSDGTNARILRDVLKAQATITALNQGYTPDTLVVDDQTYAYVASDPTVINAARREDPSNPIYTGAFPVIGGLRVLPTPNLPAAGAWVIDSTMLGGLADEALGGGYAMVGSGVETKSIRDDEEDQWRLRVRRVFTPWVMEPNAAVKITGI
jgi:hypothetical protein